MTFEPATINKPDRLRQCLLSWYRLHQRPLPWRTQPTLYGTWISEIMLQQTLVNTVVPYWERFVRRLPDVARLAAATEDEVLTLWSGLGYYRRARLLHRAAREVVDLYGGALPASYREWLALPGIGRYSAGAIASIGLGERVCAVDANARRVISRWLFAAPEAAAGYSATQLASVATDLVDPARPGDWNQAVMELGATHCRTRQIDCSGCPVARFCRAGAAGTAREIPPPRIVPEPIAVATSCLVWLRDDRVVLVPPGHVPLVRAQGCGRPLRTDFSALHPGLWNLPATPWYRSRGAADEGASVPRAFLRAWRGWLPGKAGPSAALELAGFVRHAITHHRLRVQVVIAMGTGDGADMGLPPGAELISIDQLDASPISNLARKCLKLALRPNRRRNERGGSRRAP